MVGHLLEAELRRRGHDVVSPDLPSGDASYDLDAELRAYDERLREVMHVSPTDNVLDIGCGSGKTTRDAARAATLGTALGIDLSEQLIERARRGRLPKGCTKKQC